MKKRVTAADGSTHELEGTAEELAEYERKLRKGDVSEEKGTGKRRLLKEEQEHVGLHKMLEQLRDEIRRDAARKRDIFDFGPWWGQQIAVLGGVTSASSLIPNESHVTRVWCQEPTGAVSQLVIGSSGHAPLEGGK